MYKSEKMTDLVLIILSIVFYLLFYASYPLFSPDEGRYAEIGREMLAHHQYIVPYLNNIPYFEKPPLMYWLVSFSQALLGPTTAAARLPVVLIAIFGIISSYVFTRLIYSRRTALLTIGILSTSLLYYGLGHYLTLDMPLAVWLSCSLFSFLLVIQNDEHWRYRHYALVSAYFFIALGMMTKGLVGFVFPCMITGLWVILHWRWQLVKKLALFRGLLFVALLITPWHVLIYQKYHNFINYYIVNQQILRYSTDIAGRGMPIAFYILAVISSAFPWVFFAARPLIHWLKNIYKNRKSQPIESFLWLWIIAIVVFYGFSHSKLVTYTLPILPPLAILTARWFEQHWNNKVRLEAYLVSAGFLILEAGFFLLAYHPEWLIENPAHHYFTYCFILAGLCCFNAIILILFSRSTAARYYFSLLTTMALFLLAITLFLPKLYSKDNIYPIAQQLQQQLKKDPTAKVVMYKEYSQALPFYLQRTIFIADWRNELAYGASIDPARASNLISLKQLTEFADKKEKLWIVVSQDNQTQLENQLNIQCYKSHFWYRLCPVNNE